METQEFEEISKEEYNLSTPITFIIISSFLFILLSFMIINIFIYINPPLYTMNNVMIIVIMLIFLDYIFIIIFFKRKHALNYHVQYYKNKNIADNQSQGPRLFAEGVVLLF